MIEIAIGIAMAAGLIALIGFALIVWKRPERFHERPSFLDDFPDDWEARR